MVVFEVVLLVVHASMKMLKLPKWWLILILGTSHTVGEHSVMQPLQLQSQFDRLETIEGMSILLN